MVNVQYGLKNRITVSQEGKPLYDSVVSDECMEINGVTDGKVEIGLGYYLIPLEVKSNSIVIINETMFVRRRKAVAVSTLLLLLCVGIIVPHSTVFSIVMLVLLLAWAVYFLPSRYKNKPEKLYKVFII